MVFTEKMETGFFSVAAGDWSRSNGPPAAAEEIEVGDEEFCGYEGQALEQPA